MRVIGRLLIALAIAFPISVAIVGVAHSDTGQGPAVIKCMHWKDLIKITRLLVEHLNRNLREKGITISLDDAAVEWLLAKTLSDRSYGARPLRRAIQRHVEDALSEAFIRGQIRSGRAISVGVKEGALWYEQDDRGGTLSA